MPIPRKPLAVFFGLALLPGCVHTDTQMLDSKTAILSARGGIMDASSAMQKKLLVEAAKVTQTRGYPYFRVLESADRSTAHHGIYQAPTLYQRTAPGQVIAIPGAVSGNTSIKPGADITIRMFNEGDVNPDQFGVWSVRDVLAQTPEK